MYTDAIPTNLKIEGSPIVERKFYGRTFTKDQVKGIVEKMQNHYKGHPWRFMVSIDIPDIGAFRSGKSFSIGDNPNIEPTGTRKESSYEWTETNKFIVYMWLDNKATRRARGGNGEKGENDCLFRCLQKVLTHYRLPKELKTDADLKKMLGLQVGDKVPLEFMAKVEKMFDVNVFVSGDFSFTSAGGRKKSIHLLLENEHFTVEPGNKKDSQLLHGIPMTEKKLVVVDTLTGANDDIVKCFDGNNWWDISFDAYYKRTQDFKGENAYLNDLPLKNKTGTLEGDYHEYMRQINILKDRTGGKMDLAKAGYIPKNLGMKLLHNSLLAFPHPEPLSANEHLWIYDAFQGGVIFSSAGARLQSALQYDMNSAYPAMMASPKFSFPVKEGRFTQLDDFPENGVIGYGLYECTIEPSGDENRDKLFRFNNEDIYTHFDVKLAMILKLEIQLKTGDEANALLYETERATGSQYFGQVVDELYSLKKDVPLVKSILSSMWGGLCARNKTTKTTRKMIDLKNGEDIIHIEDCGVYKKVVYLPSVKKFKTDYARLGVFLTSAVRFRMANLIYPYRNHVHRCHTDSILSDIPLEGLPLSASLGDFKLEKEGHVNIVHSNRCIWGVWEF